MKFKSDHLVLTSHVYFKRFTFILSVCGSVLHMYHVHAVPMETRRGHQIFWNWELNLGFMAEQLVLLTTKHLSSPPQAMF